MIRALKAGGKPLVILCAATFGGGFVAARSADTPKAAKHGCLAGGRLQIDAQAALVAVVHREVAGAGSREPARLRGRRFSRARDREAVTYHYDTSNEFFACYLDERMVYTCAYFESSDDDLDTAQEQKLDLVCRKLRLREGERLLDIGCGWGALVMRGRALRRRGARTALEPQAELANERIRRPGSRAAAGSTSATTATSMRRRHRQGRLDLHVRGCRGGATPGLLRPRVGVHASRRRLPQPGRSEELPLRAHGPEGPRSWAVRLPRRRRRPDLERCRRPSGRAWRYPGRGEPS